MRSVLRVFNLYYNRVEVKLLSSASTDADVCVDRCGFLRRPMRMSASTDARSAYNMLNINKKPKKRARSFLMCRNKCNFVS